MTELGYGNNAVEMETTAIYDPKTKEFIVNTPHPLAQKYWITNGAVHAKHVVVMAKLIVNDVSTYQLPIEHTGAKPHFLSRNPLDFHISKM